MNARAPYTLTRPLWTLFAASALAAATVPAAAA